MFPLGNVDDPAYRTSRIAARSVLLPLSSTPPGTPFGFNDSVDSDHPANIDFILPLNVKPNFATLSVKFRLYRTYSSFTLSATGGASASHTHPHSATHTHTIHVLGNQVGPNTIFSGAGTNFGWTGISDVDSAPSNSTAPGTSDVNSQDHTHAVSGSSTLGVTESGTITTISAIAIDGIDVTAQCPATATTPAGGPWTSDFVNLDLTALMPTGNDGFHVVTLTATSLGRFAAFLRLG